MCLAIPGRVVALEGLTGKVDFSGIQRVLCMDLLPEVRVGDYVLAHAGFAIQRLDAKEAEETMALLAELEAAAGGAESRGGP